MSTHHAPSRSGPLRIALIGAGSRGVDVYGRTMLRHGARARIVALNEPDPPRLSRAAALHDVPPEGCFGDDGAFWRHAPVLDLDAVFIAYSDAAHIQHVL